MTIEERTEIRLPSGRVIAVGDEVRSCKRQGAPRHRTGGVRVIQRIVDAPTGVRIHMRDGGRPLSLASLMKDYEFVAPIPHHAPPAKEAAAPVPPPAQKAEQVPLVIAAQPATATQLDAFNAFMSMRRAIHAETRRALIDDVLRCTHNALPPQVDEMVRKRIFTREGLSRMSAHAIVRETAAILATWLARGAP